MKVLWVEDHARAGELLTAAATAASRKRYGIDLVVAPSFSSARDHSSQPSLGPLIACHSPVVPVDRQ